jgi:hypothetical protein
VRQGPSIVKSSAPLRSATTRRGPPRRRWARRQAKGRRCAHRQQTGFLKVALCICHFFSARVRCAVLPLCPVMSRVSIGMPHINENGVRKHGSTPPPPPRLGPPQPRQPCCVMLPSGCSHTRRPYEGAGPPFRAALRTLLGNIFSEGGAMAVL